jgi:fructose-bisphosphate aldolase class II
MVAAAAPLVLTDVSDRVGTLTLNNPDERNTLTAPMVAAIIRQLREETGHPFFLNADHTYSLDHVKEAIDAGFDSVIIDGAALPFEENIEKTKACVDYARASGKEVLVEGELGFIGRNSQLLAEIPEGAAVTEDMMTTPEDALSFVEMTGIDLLAPAVGNMHGMLKNGSDPRLSIERIKAIAERVPVPLVLHGGSGLVEEDFLAAIKAGIAEVHISTDLRRAYRSGLEEGLANAPDELAPHTYVRAAQHAVEEKALYYLKLFNRGT